VALYDNLVALADVCETESRTVAAEGDTVADALRALLAEALFLFDTEGFLAAGATVTVQGGASVEETGPTAVLAELYGEPLDRNRHELLAEVKAVTFHRLQAEALPDGSWRATVLLDV
jgi:SHS2 domain-containing protein